MRFGAGRQAMRGQEARRFADVPFHGMQAVAPVGDVRGPEVLARGQEVPDALRTQGAKGNGERQGVEVDGVVEASRWVQADARTANPDAIGEGFATGWCHWPVPRA